VYLKFTGWICYAEKTHGEFILPYLSTTKSPQAVMGTLVKRHLSAAMGWDPAKVYHATVMPCYDKKLEASREDFYLPGEDLTGTLVLL
jgi:iron only hydrogenase large subunit-like protein